MSVSYTRYHINRTLGGFVTLLAKVSSTLLNLRTVTGGGTTAAELEKLK